MFRKEQGASFLVFISAVTIRPPNFLSGLAHICQRTQTSQLQRFITAIYYHKRNNLVMTNVCYIVQFNQTTKVSTNVSKISSYKISRTYFLQESRPSLRKDGETNRGADTTRLSVAFGIYFF